MKPMKPEAQAPMEALREIDTVILRTSEHGMRLIQQHAEVSMIHAQVGFLQTLYRRRDGILRDLHTKGYTDGDIYGRGRWKDERGADAGDCATATAGHVAG